MRHGSTRVGGPYTSVDAIIRRQSFDHAAMDSPASVESITITCEQLALDRELAGDKVFHTREARAVFDQLMPRYGF